MRQLALALGTLAALSIAAPAQAATTLVNENFSSGLGVFTATGQAGINTGNGYNPCCHTSGTAANMSNPFVAFGSNNLPSGDISVPIQVLGTENFTLTFNWGVLGDEALTEFIRIEFAGNTVTTSALNANDNMDTAFHLFTANFLAVPAQNATLRISSSGNANVDAIIDNIMFVTSGNRVTGVPEPASWAMMLLGFAAVGFAMRRQKRSLVAA